MVITSDFLASVFTRFRALWSDTFLAAQQEMSYPSLVMEVPSTTLTESYNWLGTVPIMKKWIDVRQHQGMYPYNYSLTNDHYEVTTDVDRDTFEDDQLGQIAPRISQLGMEAPRFLDFTAVTALDAGTTAGNNSYDAVTFYNTAHVTGVNTAGQTNRYAATGSTLVALQADFSGAKSQMRRVKDDQGRPMNLAPNLILAPPELEQPLLQLLNSSFIPAGAVAAPMGNTFIGQSQAMISAYLTSTTAWHMLATRAAAWKPLIFQNRKSPEFVGVTALDAPNVFERKFFSYGVDSRFKIGYGMWEVALLVS